MALKLAQAPAPSQVPSKRHVAGAMAVHWFFGSVPAVAALQEPAPLQTRQWPHSLPGSLLLGVSEQVPSEPDALHDWQSPSQAVAQQTPSAQKLD